MKLSLLTRPLLVCYLIIMEQSCNRSLQPALMWKHYRRIIARTSPDVCAKHFKVASSTLLNCFNNVPQAVPGVSAQAFSKLDHLVTFYSQANQGLPCELRQPAVLQDRDSITDDETGEAWIVMKLYVSMFSSRGKGAWWGHSLLLWPKWVYAT